MTYIGIRNIQNEKLYQSFDDYTRNEVLFQTQHQIFQKVFTKVYDFLFAKHNQWLLPNFPCEEQEFYWLFQTKESKMQNLSQRSH